MLKDAILFCREILSYPFNLRYMKILLMGFIFFPPQLLFSQNHILKFEHLSVQDGLEQEYVLCILKDSKGFMWLGTEDGLNRYDGKRFKVYKHNPADSNSLSNNHVQAIYEDKNGNLWIGTYGGGLDKYEPATEKFVHYRYDPIRNSISSDFILSIYEDKSGFLWIGTENGGINIFDRIKNRWISYQNDPENPNSLSYNIVRAIYEDEEGIIWIGTDGGGLNKFDRETGNFTCYKHDPGNSGSLSHNFVVAIVEDKKEALWLATFGGGLEKFDKVNETFKHYKHNPKNLNSPAQDVLQDIALSSTEPDVIWIATSNAGIDKFEIRNEKFTHYKYNPYDPRSLSSDDVSTIYEDINGLVWVGTVGKGLSKYNHTSGKIIHYDREYDNSNSLNSNKIYPIFEDESGILWIGTNEGGLNKLDGKKGIFTHYKYQPDNLNSIVNNDLFSIIEEKPGILWIGTRGGLSRFDSKRNQFINFKNDPENPQSLSDNIVDRLHIDRSDNLWIGTSRGLNKIALSKVRTNPVFFHYMNDTKNFNSISGNIISEIYEDNDGFLWVGTSSNGLNKFDYRTNQFSHYKHDPHDPNSISNNSIAVVYQDKNDILWVGTLGGGLNKFNPENQTFTHFEENDGLCNNFVYGILEDDHHNLWVSTRNGLSKFNPDKVNEKGIILPSAFKNYYVEDGFQDNVYHPTSYFKNNRGEMLFGGINGFDIFHPDSLTENQNIPNIILSEFSVLNKPFHSDSSITAVTKIVLPHDKNFFSFRFAALDFTNPSKNQYAYKLEGLDGNWIYSGNVNFAGYTGVDPGEYTFRVKGSNNDGVWNKAGISIKIIILPPWWRTWWAYSFYGLLFLSTLYGLRRYELNRLSFKNQVKMDEAVLREREEMDKMKSNFFANISHEFRTPLTLILGPIKQISEKIKDNKTKNELKIIYKNAGKLLRLVNQLLDLSKVESGNMKLQTDPQNIVSVIKILVLSFSSYAERKKIKLKFDSTQEEIIAYIDKEKIEKIVTNILSNAFKFTPEGGIIELKLSNNLEYVNISIRDTGIGIPKEKISKIFDRFYQVDGTHKRDHEGTGIGLALSKELIELHKGKIKVESTEGEGSIFTISIPLGEKLYKEEEICKPVNKENTVYNLIPESKFFEETNSEKIDANMFVETEKPILLLVEDNSDVRSYIRENMEKDYTVLEAVNGEEGLKKSIEHIPDLIISDIMMPKMDGIELCEKLKTDKITSHIPVILLTAKATSNDKIIGFETGADDYILKPFDAKELKVRIKNLINQRKKLQEHFRQKGIFDFDNGHISSIDQKFLKKTLEVINQYISDPGFSVDKLADEINLSRSQLHRKLVGIIGESPGDLTRRIRLSKAAKLVEEKFGNISEIAIEVGFNNPANFAQSFRNQFGVSPSKYKQQHSK